MALVIGDVIEFQEILAHIEVMPFNFALRAFDGLVERPVRNGLTTLASERDEHIFHSWREEYAHQIVFEREIEGRRTRVALPSGSTPKLIVNTARFVPLSAYDVQSADLENLVVLLLPSDPAKLTLLLAHALALIEHERIAAQDNVGAAARHVGGDGHRSLATGLRDHLCFALMVLGVQHLVRNLALIQFA